MFKKYPGSIRWNTSVAALLVVLLCLPPPPAVLAAAIVVNSTADTVANDGQCTLREAIVAANTNTALGDAAGECAAGAGEDTIDLTGIGGTITLTGALPPFESDIVLNGPGPDVLSIWRGSLGGDYRILEVGSDVNLTLSGLTIGNGRVVDGRGGGILNLGTLTVEACVVRDNSAYDGGGIYNEGTLELGSSTIRDNEASGEGSFAADGGGIYNLGVVQMYNSTLHDNQARDLGGGIYNGGRVGEGPDPTVRLTNSSVIGNSAMHGGGVANSEGMIELAHSTIAGNRAVKVGEFGGVGGGFRNLAGVVSSKNSLIAENTAPTAGADCYNVALLVSLGYNLVGEDNGCNWPHHTHDLVDVVPRLGPLQDNGGPTVTRALLVGSPAFDAVPLENCTDLLERPVSADQRGVLRPQGSGCDIGAYEAQTTELSLDKSTSKSELPEGEKALFVVEVDNAGPLEATGLVISDVLPLGLTFVASSASQGTYTSDSGRWIVGDLAVGLSAALTLTTTAAAGTAGTTITNVAAIAAVGQFDSNLADNAGLAAVAVLARPVIYVPGVMFGYVFPLSFPVYVGDAILQRPIRHRGEVFYQAPVRMPDELPAGGSFYFSAQPTGRTQVLVDDELAVLVDGHEVFAQDFSTGGSPVPATVEMPRATLQQMVGRTVLIEYRDVYGSVIEASEMWLIWVP